MIDAFRAAANEHFLDVFGLTEANPSDKIGAGTIALLGPREPGFWPFLKSSPEWQDGREDPVDRWSKRVITDLARDFDATAHFPFGGTLHPFMSWAIRSGRAWASPVHLLVHDTAGLMVSYRGAVLLPGVLPLETASAAPCESCAERPCLTACPVGALNADGYDLKACHTYLDTPNGRSCMKMGCQVRRSCPISASYGRMEGQSAFHMEQFHR